MMPRPLGRERNNMLLTSCLQKLSRTDLGICRLGVQPVRQNNWRFRGTTPVAVQSTLKSVMQGKTPDMNAILVQYTGEKIHEC